MELKVKRLTPKAKLPTKAHNTDAGLDLYADLSVRHGGVASTTIYPDIPQKIATGIAISIPDGYCGVIKDRSSMASRGITISGGVIDSSYRGEVMVLLTANPRTEIQHGDKIAQMLILPVPIVEIVEVDALNETTRGEGGFGSTGQ